MLILTKSVSNVILSSVQTEYGINWSNVILNDLLKPLYSGLAARLYLQYIQEKFHLKIPTFLAAQANYWQKRYNPSGDANNFITKSNELKNGKCINIKYINICHYTQELFVNPI